MPNTSSMIATCCWRRSCRACCYTTPQRLLYYRQRTEWSENWITFRIHCWTPSTKRLRSIWMYIDTVLVLLLRRKWKLILPCTCCDGYDCCFVENSKLTAYFLYFSFFLTILQVFYIWDAIFAETPEDFDLCDFIAVSILITIKKLILAQEEIQTLLPVLKPFFTFEESKQIVHLAREIRSVWIFGNLDCNDLENLFLKNSSRRQQQQERRRSGRDLQYLESTFSSTDMDSSLWHTEKEVYRDHKGLLFSTSILPPTLLLSSSKSSILTNQYV